MLLSIGSLLYGTRGTHVSLSQVIDCCGVSHVSPACVCHMDSRETQSQPQRARAGIYRGTYSPGPGQARPAGLCYARAVVGNGTCSRTNRGEPRGGFIPAGTLLQNGTAGDNGTTGGTLTKTVLGFLVG